MILSETRRISLTEIFLQSWSHAFHNKYRERILVLKSFHPIDMVFKETQEHCPFASSFGDTFQLSPLTL